MAERPTRARCAGGLAARMTRALTAQAVRAAFDEGFGAGAGARVAL